MDKCKCVNVLELFYGGYWRGIDFVKSRNTYSLATIAVTIVFNVSSNRLVLSCHVHAYLDYAILLAFLIWKHVLIIYVQSGANQKSWIQLQDTFFMK